MAKLWLCAVPASLNRQRALQEGREKTALTALCLVPAATGSVKCNVYADVNGSSRLLANCKSSCTEYCASQHAAPHANQGSKKRCKEIVYTSQLSQKETDRHRAAAAAGRRKCRAAGRLQEIDSSRVIIPTVPADAAIDCFAGRSLHLSFACTMTYKGHSSAILYCSA